MYKLPLPLTSILSIFIPSNNKTKQKQTWFLISFPCVLLDLKYKINLEDRRKNGICLLIRTPLNWALAGYPQEPGPVCAGHTQCIMHISAQFHLTRTRLQSSGARFYCCLHWEVCLDFETLGFKKEVSPVNAAPGFYPAPLFPFLMAKSFCHSLIYSDRSDYLACALLVAYFCLHIQRCVWNMRTLPWLPKCLAHMCWMNPNAFCIESPEQKLFEVGT